MGITIGRKWPSDAPVGDMQAKCDFCGVRWRRSQLRMLADGKLACPDEGPGRDAVTLTEGNAALSEHRPPVDVPPGGGNYSNGDEPIVYARTPEEAGL